MTTDPERRYLARQLAEVTGLRLFVRPTSLGSIGAPTLAVAGGAAPDFMRGAARFIADGVPHGQFRVLEGQTHELSPEALGPVLRDFLTG